MWLPGRRAYNVIANNCERVFVFVLYTKLRMFSRVRIVFIVAVLIMMMLLTEQITRV